eukprot:m.10342 g.10342  ORF g.10342 m.10342 type:complete len:423 (-) comp8261_c0_seq1:131-1399(-)
MTSKSSFRSRLFGPRRESNTVTKEDILPIIEDGQPLNPFDEVFVFDGHSDIVRHIIPLDLNRVATASDDHTVIIWDLKEQTSTLTLKGHTLPVTCLLRSTQLGCSQLLSSSADKSIMVWNTDTGVPVACWTEHRGSVKAMMCLENRVCCTGGKDLCLWSLESNLLLDKYKRDTEDTYIQSMISLSGDRVLTASEGKGIVIYKVENFNANRLAQIKIMMESRIEVHNEPIRSILNITASTFATGSLDGEIKLWDSRTLTELAEFNLHGSTGWDNDRKQFVFSVQHLAIFKNAWIVAAIGCGFAVYDTTTYKEIASVKKAHHAHVSRLLVLDTGFYLVTGSVDAILRIWNLEALVVPEVEFPIEPVLIGELVAHSQSINDLAPAGRSGFVSCGSDSLVISWKNGIVEWQRRNVLARNTMCTNHD